MNIEMIPLEIIGLKKDLQEVIHSLRRMGCVHIDELAEAPQVSARPLTLDRQTLSLQEELSFLAARIDGLLETLGGRPKNSPSELPKNYLEEARKGTAELLPQVQNLTACKEELQSRLAALPRYEATLRRLLPIIPPSAREPQNVTVGILASRAHMGVLDSVAKRILDLTNGRAEVVASDVDSATRAMLIVFPDEYTQEIETLLGNEDVSRLRLPEELGKGLPDEVLATIQRQLSNTPHEIAKIDEQLGKLAGEWRNKLAAWSALLHDEIDGYRVLSRFGETDMTFVLAGWVPAKELERVISTLHTEVGESVLVRQLSMTGDMKKRAPVSLKNPAIAQPFSSLVNLLALPRYGHIDPTNLMAFFLPIFFGMILGDVGYGGLLLILSLFLIRKLKPGVMRDVAKVLAMGSVWAILFGILFGEAFGTLGEELGMHALWFERTGPEHVAALLVMTIGVGAVHITLGLILGVFEAWRDRSRSHLLERGGMLVGLISLFFIVGVATKYLPQGFMTPAIAGLIVGIVLLGASLGWLGLLMGPIEFIGLIGNVLSYLRIAAIGLASVYLAKVANDVAGFVGNLVVGLIVAVLIHALNLVLGAFSPTIHSLRLHYVEFFRKFYEGGGRAYEPYRSHLQTELKA